MWQVMAMTKSTLFVTLLVVAVTVFLGWRFMRPMNIFTVSEAYERPIPTDHAPALFKTLSAEECAVCHRAFYEEWRTTIHSQAWTDPYFQSDWRFDGEQQICKNCHTPLDRQQAHLVVGFNDRDKWDPILAHNPDFDAKLQHEGVTCAACHYRDGFILGPYGDHSAPHPVRQLDNPNHVCVRCHVVVGDRWDTFFRFPPCGTVAEIQTARGGAPGEVAAGDFSAINCVDCHMPLVVRPVVEGGKARAVRRHLWRGGHDPQMVQSGLDIELAPTLSTATNERGVALTLTNTGAAHYLPTGTPDRHLTVSLHLLDEVGNTLAKQDHTLKRTVMWRPFIIDLWDTRLKPFETRRYDLTYDGQDKATTVEAVVYYHLLGEKRRRRIGYANEAPIAYEVFNRRLSLGTAAEY